MLLNKNCKRLKLGSLLFIGAGVGAGEKIPGAGQTRTGSATLTTTDTNFPETLTRTYRYQLLCGSGIQKMFIWIRIRTLRGKDKR